MPGINWDTMSWLSIIRGFGLSRGEPSEFNCYDDADAALNWLRHNRMLNNKFIIHGKSIGGAVAAKLAINNNCDGLVIESSLTSIQDLGKQRFPFIPEMLYYNDFPTEMLLKSVNSPVLVMHSPENESIPFSMGKKLFRGSERRKKFLHT